MKKIIFGIIAFIVFYILVIQLQVLNNRDGKNKIQNEDQAAPSHRVYSFSFSKFSTEGEKELDIEGDSADILSKTVNLMNVVAKAYASETPVTITSDKGFYDKEKEKVHLKENVVATTEDGTRLLTEELDIFPNDKSMETDVQAEVKKDNFNIEGLGARGESNLKKVKFKKNVTVVIQDPDDKEKTPTVITCDGPLTVDYDENIAHFRDNVVAVDQQGTLRAERMDVYYNKEVKRVAKIVAMDKVIIESPDGNKTYSDHAIYLAEEGRVILGGDADVIYFDGSKAPDFEEGVF